MPGRGRAGRHIIVTPSLCHRRLVSHAARLGVHDVHHGLCQRQRGLKRRGLGVDPHHVFGAARAHEGPALRMQPDECVDLGLKPLRLHTDALRVSGLEQRSVGDLDLDLPVGQVRVHRQPLRAGPVQRAQDDLHRQHDRNRVANGLVDEIAHGQQPTRRGAGLAAALRCRRDALREGLAEERGAVAVRLEVYADIQLQSGVVAVLHARLGAEDVVRPHRLHRLASGGPVGVGRLHEAQAEALDASLSEQLRQEVGQQQRDAVPVQQLEGAGVGEEEIHDPVRVAVQGDKALARAHAHAAGRRLLYLHEVSPASLVEGPPAVVAHRRAEACRGEALEHAAECHGAHAVGAIDHDLARVSTRGRAP
mmetsp:Transcript_92048/g.260195  ORF Transcript_92048/g.260195 Transcript_92048/m.260195 type:complete len:364 (-) Transcript_92048:487-1578(-)